MMKTFNAEKKQFYIDRAIAHREADEIVQGLYWKNGKECCVGCLAHDNDTPHEILHNDQYGPEWLTKLADSLHESLPDGEYQKWPELLTKSIPEEVNYDALTKKVKAPFMVFVLESSLENFDHNKNPDVKRAIDNCINLWKRDDIETSKWYAAAESAWSVAESAWSAAESAESAESAKSAESAWSVAESAESAARSAAWSAARSAKSAAYIKFRDKLVELLEAV